MALFAVAPLFCSCLLSLVYGLYLFMAYEESGVHFAQEYENRFWTIFALLFSTALFFAQDSPLAFGLYSPSLGFLAVVLSSYAMHLWDRFVHRKALSRQTKLRRSYPLGGIHNTHGSQGKVTVEEQLAIINDCLQDIDQLLIPSTINNFINQRFVFKKEKRIIRIFLECDAVALNYLVCHVKLGLLIYKIKDHRNFAGQHRTELVQLLAFDRLPALTVISRVIVLHALQILKLRANPRAEYWVRNIFLSTHGDDLSEIKSLTDAKGDYFSMNKLIFDDIKSETVRQDILAHFRKEGALQRAHMQMGTKRAQRRQHMAWRKILSDVDDTLVSSGGSYPAGIDKRYAKKVVYPGVLAFYRELDLGTSGPEEWPEDRVGNLVFLSARPHVYKDMSEKSSFKKFEKLRMIQGDGRKGMHTVPSMLPGDITSGSQYIATNDFEPLAKKKYENFKRYVSIYPEYQHIFVCDNGQGDVRAGELMFDSFPYEVEALYVHVVQDPQKTHGYAPQRWREKELYPCFFHTYPEAALHAASRSPPLIRVTGLRRVCHDAVKDFTSISSKKWQSEKQKADRRAELNQSIWRANQFLTKHNVEPVELIQAQRLWKDGQRVKTPYGRGIIKGFDPENNQYQVTLDWRPLNVQVNEHLQKVKEEVIRPRNQNSAEKRATPSAQLETVVENDEASAEDGAGKVSPLKPPGTPTRTFQTSRSASTDGEGFSFPSGTKDTKKTASTSDRRTGTSVVSDSSSISSISSDGSRGDQKSSREAISFMATAKIDGRLISKYTPPHLVEVDKDKKPSPLVSFWAGSPKRPTRQTFTEGDKCSTPYGLGTVVEHRLIARIVVVDMVGWKARAYLNEDIVRIEKGTLLSSLFRRPTQEAEKKLEFPYAQGTEIPTPFGKAKVTTPLSAKFKKEGWKTDPEVLEQTIVLSFVTWSLADGTNPKLYCTVKAAQMWKESAGNKSQDGLLSAFGTLVSSTFDFAGRFSAPKTKGDAEVPGTKAKNERYYSDAAAVSTSFGDGRILDFRESDGFYKISLSKWTMANKKHPIAWIRGIDIKYSIAKDCQEGYPVLTKLGLTGILKSVQPTTGKQTLCVSRLSTRQPNSAFLPFLQY